ncbi:MAG: amidohydrolase family protein [Oscillospiraceae bacterium]
MIIDTHTHYLDGNWLCAAKGGLPIEDMVRTQQELGVSEMWISSTGALADDFEFYNKNMYEKTKGYEKNFRKFATASMYYQKKALNNIRKCIEDYGFWGIKVHFWMQGGSVQMKATHELMEMSIEYKMPVLFHDGTPPASDSLQIGYLADLYPEAKIILGHSGMFDTPKSAVEMCNTHKNVYLCISCSTLNDAQMIVCNAKQDRLLFGSDYGAAESRDVLTDRIDIIEEACKDKKLKQSIFAKNANALLQELGAVETL